MRLGARAGCLAFALAACSSGAAGPDAPIVRPGPDAGECSVAPEPRVTLMTYNIKHAELSSLDEVAARIYDSSPDVTAIEEGHQETTASAGEDQVFRLGQKTGRASALRTTKPIAGGGFQTLGLLARLPIKTNERVDLTSVDEQRVLMIITLELAPGVDITVGVTHFGLGATERLTQAEEVVAAMAGRPRPIVLGDFNERPDGPAIAILAAAFRDAWPLAAASGDGFTFPASAPDRRIDYVWLGEGWGRPIEIHVVDGDESDHRPLFVTMPFPR